MPSQHLWCAVRRLRWDYRAGYLYTLLILLTGCATFDQWAGFSDVRATVEARSGKRVAWNPGTDLDTQAAEEVHALLERV
jgi:hypothetical protein